jgi:hypothetical protein
MMANKNNKFTMSTGSQRIGQASSTAAASDAALRLYEIYRKRKGKTLFKDLRAIEIQGENLEHEIIGYC